MTSWNPILSGEGKENEKNESRSCAKIGSGTVIPSCTTLCCISPKGDELRFNGQCNADSVVCYFLSGMLCNSDVFCIYLNVFIKNIILKLHYSVNVFSQMCVHLHYTMQCIFRIAFSYEYMENQNINHPGNSTGLMLLSKIWFPSKCFLFKYNF